VPAADLPLRAAVLGSPIAHSLSPALHRAAYTAAGVAWRYDAIEVTAEQLPDFLDACGPRWVGLSLTMPLKEAALPLLAGMDPIATMTRSVNTIVLAGSPAGSDTPWGHNTDVGGIVAAIRETGRHDFGSVTVLGSGATARSAAAAAAQFQPGEMTIAARRSDAAEDVRQVALAAGVVNVAVAPWLTADQHTGADLVISTVPKGAADWLAAAATPTPGVLLDVVYDPWPTALATSWDGVVVSGMSMLLWQAVDQIWLWGGFRPDVSRMRAAIGLTVPGHPQGDRQ